MWPILSLNNPLTVIVLEGGNFDNTRVEHYESGNEKREFGKELEKMLVVNSKSYRPVS